MIGKSNTKKKCEQSIANKIPDTCIFDKLNSHQNSRLFLLNPVTINRLAH